MQPNKKRIRKWVKALRDGDYTQAEGALRAIIDKGKIGYCCLGVLANISIDDLGGCWIEGEISLFQLPIPEGVDEEDYDEEDYEFGGETGLIHHQWLGLNVNCLLVKRPEDATARNIRDKGDISLSLATLNDHGYTFDEIADLIEKEWLS